MKPDSNQIPASFISYAADILADTTLEKLIQEVLGRKNSLENQIPVLGPFVKANGGSKEFANMFGM